MSDNKCYTCAFRSSIPGDCHSKCSHPLMNKMTKDPVIMMSAAVGMVDLSKVFGMEADSYGVQSGWCSFPMNFDPTWLHGQCKAHMTKEEHDKLLSENPKAKELEQEWATK